MTIENTPPARGTSLSTAVICTALRVEYEEVKALLKNTFTQHAECGTLYEIGAFPADHPRWTVVLTRTGPGIAPAGIQVERAIRLFDPEVVLFVGVAGGCKDEDVNIGSVVIADYVYDFQSGKDGEDGFAPRIRTLPSSYRLLQRAGKIADDDVWQRRTVPTTAHNIAKDTPDARSTQLQDKPQAVVKPIASGSVVVADRNAATARFLKQYCDDAVAVEMEGLGVLLGAYVNAKVDALVVRGISDLLSGKTPTADRYWQPIASRHAAAFAFELLDQYTPPSGNTGAPVTDSRPPLLDLDGMPRGEPLPSPWVRVGALPTLVDRFQHRDVADALDRTTTAVLSGSGGVGKTQSAIQYAARQWRDTEVRLVAWISARSRDAVRTGYTQAAVDLLGADPADPDQAVAQLLAWLAEADQRWLIVLDDLHDPEDMRGLWPPTNRQGRMVVTTRRRDPSLASTDRVLLDVDVFTRAEALGYLHAKLADHPRLREGAEDLAEAVGFLPLALAQAVAYLATRGVTCRQYCDHLADQRRTQPEPGNVRGDHDPTVLATSALSAELADSLAPVGLAKPVMVLASMLDPAGIPVAVFTTKRVVRFLARVVGRSIDRGDVRGALRVVHRLNLASLNEQTALPVLRVHPLVQSAIRLSAAHQAPEQVFLGVGEVAEALLETWPDVERDMGLIQTLRANTEVLHSKEELLLWLTSAHAVLVRAGRSLGGAGLAANACDYFQRLCAAAVEYLGSDAHDTLIIRGELAHWRGQAGDVAGAVRDGEQLVDDYQRVLGPDHPETLIARGNLISARGEEDAVAAIRDGEQLLADYQQVLSLDHHDALILRDHLARWRGQSGDLPGAIRETEEVLADRQRVLGRDHPHTLITRGDLAYWRGEAGDPAGAARDWEQLLDNFLRVLGTDHPDSRVARSNLAYWRARASDGPDGLERARG